MGSNGLPLIVLADTDEKFWSRLEEEFNVVGYETRIASTFEEAIEAIDEDAARRVIVGVDSQFPVWHKVLDHVHKNAVKRAGGLAWAEEGTQALEAMALNHKAYRFFWDKDRVTVARLISHISRVLDNLDLLEDTNSLADKLTGLDTYSTFVREIIPQLRTSKTRGYPAVFSVLYIDADYFKSINDTYGHDVGDEAIRVIANILSTHIRPADLICRRYENGDEMVVAYRELDKHQACDRGWHLQQAVAVDTRFKYRRLAISFGVAELRQEDMNDDPFTDLSKLVRRADANLREVRNFERDKVA